MRSMRTFRGCAASSTMSPPASRSGRSATSAICFGRPRQEGPRRSRSLQWILVRRLVLLQAATLLIFIVLCAAALWIANPTLAGRQRGCRRRLKDAVDRDPDGRLIVRETEELTAFPRKLPQCLVHRSRRQRRERARRRRAGQSTPASFGDLLGGADQRHHRTLRQATCGRKPISKTLRPRPARCRSSPRRVVAPADRRPRNQHLGHRRSRPQSGRQPQLGARAAGARAGRSRSCCCRSSSSWGTTTLVTTPAVVRRSFAGLVETVRQAARIDIGTRAMQLPVKQRAAGDRAAGACLQRGAGPPRPRLRPAQPLPHRRGA